MMMVWPLLFAIGKHNLLKVALFVGRRRCQSSNGCFAPARRLSAFHATTARDPFSQHHGGSSVWIHSFANPRFLDSYSYNLLKYGESIVDLRRIGQTMNGLGHSDSSLTRSKMLFLGCLPTLANLLILTNLGKHLEDPNCNLPEACL